MGDWIPVVSLDSLPSRDKTLFNGLVGRLDFSEGRDKQVAAVAIAEDGSVHHGVNVDVSGQSTSQCAEQSAMFAADSKGKYGSLVALLYVTRNRNPEREVPTDVDPSCGPCHQVFADVSRRSGSGETFLVTAGLVVGEEIIVVRRGLLPLHLRRLYVGSVMHESE